MTFTAAPEPGEPGNTTTGARWGASKTFGIAAALMAAVGLAMSFIIMVEKLHLMVDSEFIPSCTLNGVVACGSVMTSDQAAAFGFPNPMIGLIGFPVVMTLGVLLASGVALPRWVWWGFLTGMTAAVVFVHWLAYQAVYNIGALCPYCMVVWAMVLPLFMMVLMRVVRGARPASGSIVRPAIIVVTWYAAFALLIAGQFLV